MARIWIMSEISSPGIPKMDILRCLLLGTVDELNVADDIGQMRRAV